MVARRKPQKAEQTPLASPRRYQKTVLDDTSRFTVWVKSRQIGGSWTAGARAVDRAVLSAVGRGVDQVVMSRGLRQAKRLLLKVSIHLRAVDQLRMHEHGLPSIIDTVGTEQIQLTNGAAIMALPCDDETTVGDAADVTLDEFALFPNSEAVFEAMTPIIMNGYSIFVLSTPRGRTGKFANLFLDPRNNWSKHKTTLFDAERGGLVLRDEKDRRVSAEDFLDDLRKSGMSEQSIRQEFLCEFIDAATAFITFDLIERIQDPGLSKEVDWPLLIKHRKDGEFYIGVDVGRYHDLTVIWLWQKVGDKLICRGVEEMQDTPFDVQERRVNQYLDFKCVRRACIDATGLGIALAERLQQAYGEHRVEMLTFTQANKAHMAANLKAKAEKGELAIPVDRRIADDWHAIEQTATSSGNLRYEADRSANGHADRFWAAAMGIEAVDEAPCKVAMAFAGERDNR